MSRTRGNLSLTNGHVLEHVVIETDFLHIIRLYENKPGRWYMHVAFLC